MLEQAPAECEERLASSEALILRQRRIAADIEHDGGRDAIQMARGLPELFERSRDRHRADRERYIKMLENQA